MKLVSPFPSYTHLYIDNIVSIYVRTHTWPLTCHIYFLANVRVFFLCSSSWCWCQPPCWSPHAWPTIRLRSFASSVQGSSAEGAKTSAPGSSGGPSSWKLWKSHLRWPQLSCPLDLPSSQVCMRCYQILPELRNLMRGQTCSSQDSLAQVSRTIQAVA